MTTQRLVERYTPYTDRVAFVVVAIGPVLAFSAYSLGGFVKLFMVLPIVLLAGSYLRRPIRTFPIWEWTFVALLALSVLWSDVPDYSSERLRTYVPLMLAVVLACSVMRPDRIIRALGVGFVLILASSALLLLIDPASHERKGEFVLTAQFPKNTFGALLGVAMLLVLARPRKVNVVLVPLLAAGIALNYSVTAWIVTTLMALASLGARWAARNLRTSSVAPAMLVAALVGAGVFALTATAGSSDALEAVGKNSTLSDRTNIWAACWTEIQKAPLLGHGAYTFLDPASKSPSTLRIWAQFSGYQPPHPHNGVLDVWGQLGLVGLIVFFALMVRALRDGVRMTLRGDATARAGTTCLLFLLVFGATEPAYLGGYLSIIVPCSIACTRAWVFRNDGSTWQEDESDLDGGTLADPPAVPKRSPVTPGSKPPFLPEGQPV